MKIGVLTQPLHDNYGGLLQAYALKVTLESLGHEVTVLNRRRKEGLWFEIKYLIKKVLGKTTRFRITKKQRAIVSQHTQHFINTYIKDITKPIYSTGKLKATTKMFDIFVVGSDQVWRPRYSPNISNFYLDFLDSDKQIGVAYAASFGVDYWEYTERQTDICRANIGKFKAISVREESGIDLCRQYFDAVAVHVLDPTMLLEKSKYFDLIEKENEPSIEGQLLHYVLDVDIQKQKLIDVVAEFFDLNVFTATQKSKINSRTIKNIDDYIYPKVTTWLNSFKSAKFIITDSFHGTVFSLLFNKPFLVITNEKRGRARFESLLEEFRLEHRIVTDPSLFSLEYLKDMPEIQWDKINRTLEERKEFSLNFLEKNLKS